MGQAHRNQKKPAQPKSEINALDTPEKFNYINRKQSSPIHSRTQIHLDLRVFSYVDSEILQRFQSKTLQSTLNASWYINNHRIHEDLQMGTVLGEMEK
jgi:hypothetical protein